MLDHSKINYNLPKDDFELERILNPIKELTKKQVKEKENRIKEMLEHEGITTDHIDIVKDIVEISGYEFKEEKVADNITEYALMKDGKVISSFYEKIEYNLDNGYTCNLTISEIRYV